MKKRISDLSCLEGYIIDRYCVLNFNIFRKGYFKTNNKNFKNIKDKIIEIFKRLDCMVNSFWV